MKKTTKKTTAVVKKAVIKSATIPAWIAVYKKDGVALKNTLSSRKALTLASARDISDESKFEIIRCRITYVY